MAHFIRYLKESIGYYFYLPEDHNVIVSSHTIFLEKEFIQDGGSGRKIELEEIDSEEHQVQEPKLSYKPVDMVPPPPRRSSRVFHPLERYLGIISEDVEKVFLTENGRHGDNPKIYDKVISDIDSEK